MNSGRNKAARAKASEPIHMAIEEKVGEAAGELQEVTDLLQAEVSHRERLEAEPERRDPS